MKKITFILIIIYSYSSVIAQQKNGLVQAIVKTEKQFNIKAKEEKIKDAFLEFLADNAIIFKPNPVNAKSFFEKNEVLGKLSGKAEYALISKAGDFGFTTGPYVYNDFEKKTYGHYLSVWKTDKNKKWKLALDGRLTHPQPTVELPEVFLNPDNYNYPKLIGPKKIQMREDIVFSTDELLGKSLTKSGNASLNEFYDTSVRLYFPNHLPAFGKVAVLNFINNQKINIISTPLATDRAFSGDLAYTYGEAQINKKKYYYIRIWQIDATMKWNIIIDAYMPS